MRILTFLLSALLITGVLSAQSKLSGRQNPIIQNDEVLISNKLNKTVQFENTAAIDTLGSVPGLTQFYDYVTNGNNIRKLIVLGDTVVVSCDYTDSLNAQLSTARRSLYQVSYNGGVTWCVDPIIILNAYSAYPEILPVMLWGIRTVTITGRGLVNGGAYAGSDVQLWAGSITFATLPNAGSNGAIVSATLSSNSIACAYTKGDSLFFRTYNFVTNIFSPNPVFIAVCPTTSRYYIASNSSGTNVFIMWWDAALSQMKGKESTNGGTSFGPAVTILSNSANINGDMVTSWFPADVTYKPGTNMPCVALSTLAEGSFITAQGSKVVFWSPAVNGGQPLRLADFRNMPGTFISDTAYFNSSSGSIQVGMTALSHPSLAFSTDGTVLTCVFSVVRDYSSSYGFYYNSIYGSYSTNNGATWSNPRPIECSIPQSETTCASCDEIYPSLSKTGNSPYLFHVTYSLSECPGSASFVDVTTPICKVYQVYKRFCPQVETGVTGISGEMPQSYSLLQNYPNPFNPKTVIRFDIAKSSEVKIAVYDVSGKEVSRLVQQKLDAGKYSIDFDGSNYASGIYFYSIIAGEYVQTKKMVLVK